MKPRIQANKVAVDNLRAFRLKAISILKEHVPESELQRFSSDSVCYNGIVKILAPFHDVLWEHREELAELITEEVALQWMRRFPADKKFMEQFIHSSTIAAEACIECDADLEHLVVEHKDMIFLKQHKKNKRKVKNG